MRLSTDNQPADEGFTDGFRRWRAANRAREMIRHEPGAAAGLTRYADHHQAIGVALMAGTEMSAHGPNLGMTMCARRVAGCGGCAGDAV